MSSALGCPLTRTRSSGVKHLQEMEEYSQIPPAVNQIEVRLVPHTSLSSLTRDCSFTLGVRLVKVL